MRENVGLKEQYQREPVKRGSPVLTHTHTACCGHGCCCCYCFCCWLGLELGLGVSVVAVASAGFEPAVCCVCGIATFESAGCRSLISDTRGAAQLQDVVLKWSRISAGTASKWLLQVHLYENDAHQKIIQPTSLQTEHDSQHRPKCLAVSVRPWPHAERSDKSVSGFEAPKWIRHQKPNGWGGLF